MSDTTSPERLLAILEMFEQERRALSLKELSDACGIPMSTCHSLVHTLLRRGYLYQTGRAKDVYPTRRLHDMGVVLLEHDSVLQRLAPVLEALRARTRETVILGKRQREGVLYLEVLEGPQTIRYSARVGDCKPLHSSSIGKVMLAGLTPEEFKAWFAKDRPKRVTPSTLISAAALRENLEVGRGLGYFATRGENVPDVSAVAVPVGIHKELFGVAVAGPSHRVDAEFGKIVLALREMQKSLCALGVSDALRQAA